MQKPSKTTNNRIGNMIYRFLGNTGMQVSIIGLGNMIFDKDTTDNVDRCLQCITK